MSRRRFGYVRQLASGRWQASYMGPDGVRYRAPHTFSTEAKADKWVRFEEALIETGQWDARRVAATQEEASIKAAKIMGGLYEALEGSGYGDHEASIFLVRTLFALYADDSGVWQKDLFTEFLRSRTSEDGTDLGPQLTMLFQTTGWS